MGRIHGRGQARGLDRQTESARREPAGALCSLPSGVGVGPGGRGQVEEHVQERFLIAALRRRERHERRQQDGRPVRRVLREQVPGGRKVHLPALALCAPPHVTVGNRVEHPHRRYPTRDGHRAQRRDVVRRRRYRHLAPTSCAGRPPRGVPPGQPLVAHLTAAVKSVSHPETWVNGRVPPAGRGSLATPPYRHPSVCRGRNRGSNRVLRFR